MSPLTFALTGSGLPTSADDVQSFYFSTGSKRRALDPALDCKARGSIQTNNGTSVSCTLPAQKLDNVPYGSQLLVSVSLYSDVLVSAAPTGLYFAAPARGVSVSPCQSNCVRRAASSSLSVTVFGAELPTSKSDISVFTVTVGTGSAPTGANFSCIEDKSGISLQFGEQGSSLTCRLEQSLLTEALSGSVSVDLTVWGQQALLVAVATGEVLQAGSDGVQSSVSVGVGVGVAVAIVVAIAIAVIVIVFVVRRRFKAINQMQTVEMQELKGKLSEDEIKAVLNIKASDISLVSQLGSGAFGTVWLAHYQGKIVAVKKLSGSALSGQLVEFFREASLMLSIPKHKNIVTVYGMCQDIAALSLVMELVGNGSLDKFLRKKYITGDILSAVQLHTLLLGMAQGMAHLVR